MKRTHQIAQELVRFLPRTRENAMSFREVMHYFNIGTTDFEMKYIKSTLGRFSENQKSDLLKCENTKGYYIDLKGRNGGYSKNPIIPSHRKYIESPQKFDDFSKQTQTMIELYNSGKSLQEIGERHNLTRERIRQLLLPAKTLGIVKKRRKRVPDELTLVKQKINILKSLPRNYKGENYDRNCSIEKLVKDGLTYSQIASEVNVSRPTVSAVIYRARQRQKSLDSLSATLQTLYQKRDELEGTYVDCRSN